MRYAWGVLALCLACDGGGSDSESSATSSGSTTAPASSTSADTSASGPSSSSTGMPGPTYMPSISTCRRECNFAADCCPADLDPCPSFEFPSNFGCEDGMCVPAPCETNEQCEALTPGSTCHDVDGVPQCVVICDGDDACTPLGSGFGCGATTADGQSYCYERCDLGTPCLLEQCNPEGICECGSDDECVNGFTCDVNAGS